MSDEHKGIEERVRERAYALWEQEGRPDGREQEHWEEASRELQQNGDGAASGDGARQGPVQGGSRPSVDRLTPSAATAAPTGVRQDGAARRPGSAAEPQTRKPL